MTTRRLGGLTWRAYLAVGALVVAGVGATVGGESPTPPRAALQQAPRYDHAAGDARRVIDGFYDVWLRNERQRFSWTGDVSACRPGRVSEAATDATFGQINYFRSLAGLRPVTELSDLDGATQRTALMMDANRALSHDPPSSWDCRTTAGSRMAGRSNLALGSAGRGPRAVTLYVADPGRHNRQVGHRRWLFNPRTRAMASGSTPRANALAVVGMPQHEHAVPAWVPWPSRGYFPSPLEPRGRWSLSASNRRTDFRRARVSVVGPGGARVPVTRMKVRDGMGPNTLVWQMSSVRRPSVGEPVTYRVTVRRVRRGDRRLAPVRWSVTLVAPDRQVTSTAPPELSGPAEVGQTLYVSKGSWTPAPRTYGYQWYRDGEPIAGQTYSFYRLQADDAGAVVTAQVRATSDFHVTGRASVSVPVPARRTPAG